MRASFESGRTLYIAGYHISNYFCGSSNISLVEAVLVQGQCVEGGIVVYLSRCGVDSNISYIGSRMDCYMLLIPHHIIRTFGSQRLGLPDMLAYFVITVHYFTLREK